MLHKSKKQRTQTAEDREVRGAGWGVEREGEEEESVSSFCEASHAPCPLAASLAVENIYLPLLSPLIEKRPMQIWP